MLEPFGAVASALQIAEAVSKGFDAVRRLQPEYGIFWRQFEKKLQPKRRDLPWGEIERLRLDPDFIGEASGLIRGVHARREAILERFASIAVPPVGSRYTSEEIAAVLRDAADASAVEAAKSERAVVEQRTSLLAGHLDANQAALLDEFRRLREEIARLSGTVTGLTGEVTDLQAEVSALRRRGGGPADTGAPRSSGTIQSDAERRLAEILARDPEVVAHVAQPALEVPWAGRRYRPDFVAEDRDGINWLIEVKSGFLIDARAAQAQLDAFNHYVAKAALELDQRWEAILVSAEDLGSIGSWTELKRRGLSRRRGSGGG